MKKGTFSGHVSSGSLSSELGGPGDLPALVEEEELKKQDEDTLKSDITMLEEAMEALNPDMGAIAECVVEHLGQLPSRLTRLVHLIQMTSLLTKDLQYCLPQQNMICQEDLIQNAVLDLYVSQENLQIVIFALSK